MLYHLLDYLTTTYGHWAGARLMTYISFRAITAGIIALVTSIWFGNAFINYMKRHNISETQRDEKTDPFNVAKKGVPTMGGLIVIAAILLPCLLLGKLTNVYMILMLVTTLLMGALGFADDYIKTFRKNKDINIDAFEELEVRSLKHRRRSILDLGERIGIGGIGFWGNHLVGLGQPFAPVADQLLVVGTRHTDVHIVVPGNKTLMTYGTKHRSCPEIIAQAMFATDGIDGFQVADDLPLQDTDVVVGFVM